MYVPSELITKVPTPEIVAVWPALNVPLTPFTVNCVMLNALPSVSLSLSLTLPVILASSGPDFASLTAAGGSFTGVMEIVKVPVSNPPSPSEMVYVITGTAPA